MARSAAYDHVQRGRVAYLLHVLVLPIAALGLLDPGLWPMFIAMAAVFELLALCFHSLRVRDKGDHLLLTFGPLPLFRKRIDYSDVADAEPARSDLLDGWGIHWAPGRGWIWNIAGRDCVELQLRGGGSLRLGTDEPATLTDVVRARIATPAGRRAADPHAG